LNIIWDGMLLRNIGFTIHLLEIQVHPGIEWVLMDKELDMSSVLNLNFDFQNLETDSLDVYPPSSPSTNSPPYSSESDGSASEFDSSMLDDSMLPDIERILAENPIVNPPLSLPSSWNMGQDDGNSKKRPRDEGVKEEILLPRDQLLTMTSKEIEEYVSKLKSQRTLSMSEEKELKRQRRLIKNREYASQSRHRKKVFVDDLQKKMEAVQEENTSLKTQVQSLSEENQVLKRKIAAIAESVKKKSSSSEFLKKMTTIGRPTPNKTVSACLLVIMFMAFTFGVFWDNQPNKHLTVFPSGQSIRFNPRVILGFEKPLPILSKVDHDPSPPLLLQEVNGKPNITQQHTIPNNVQLSLPKDL